MSNGFLLRLIPLPSASYNVSSNAGMPAAFPGSNLANPQPKVVTQMAVGASPCEMYVLIDLGADTDIDTLGILFTNLSSGGRWKAYGATSAAGMPAIGSESPAQLILGFTGYIAPVAATTRDPRQHALQVGATATVRYIRIYLYDVPATNPEGLIRLGIVAIGMRLQPAFNFEFGGGRRIDDRSTMRELPGGETGGLRAAKVPIVRVTWGDLSDAELLALWSIMLEVGESEPILLVEDPDPTTGLIERMFYGTLSGLDFWERGDSNKSRIELRLKAWL